MSKMLPKILSKLLLIFASDMTDGRVTAYSGTVVENFEFHESDTVDEVIERLKVYGEVRKFPTFDELRRFAGINGCLAKVVLVNRDHDGKTPVYYRVRLESKTMNYVGKRIPTF